MKNALVIAEYNPFHNGHAHQLRELKEVHGFDHVIALMSGDFVQRGAPAILGKYRRTELALKGGADLVIELPVSFVLSGAGEYASAGVQMAKALGAVDCLAYSCEDPAFFSEGNKDELSRVLSVLTDEPEAFREALSRSLKDGNSYPKAREEALISLPELKSLKTQIEEVLRKPNNLLALSYETALRLFAPGLSSLPLERVGSGHAEETIGEDCSSGHAIRTHIKEGRDLASLKRSLPKDSFLALSEAKEADSLLYTDDFTELLKYRLLFDPHPEACQNVTPELADKLRKHQNHFGTLTELAFLLKSRDLTLTRIRRGLFSLLLELKKSEAEAAPSYARLLGFQKSAEPLLSEIKRKSSIPLISKDADARLLLQKDLRASEVYRMILEKKSGRKTKNDLQQPLIILN